MVTQEEFEQLLPLATNWVEEQESIIIREGEPLNPVQLENAREIGVTYPEKIRLLNVIEIPTPQDPILATVAEKTGLLNPTTAGLCVRYGIYMTLDSWENRQLVVHELVHTWQYERLGGITPFLRRYLDECLNDGYPDSPLEQEAVRVAGEIVSGK